MKDGDKVDLRHRRFAAMNNEKVDTDYVASKNDEKRRKKDTATDGI